MKKALVVEGGAMRGIFAAGVLDAFMEMEYDPFDLYIGVSAGSCALASFVAGQYQRNYRVYTNLMCRPGFLDLHRFITGGHYMDLDWLCDAMVHEDPLNIDAAAENTAGKEFVVVCTDASSGKAEYIEPSRSNWYVSLKASSALPLMYRKPVTVDNHNFIDGGVADPIPIDHAYKRRADEVVVIRSRPTDYVKARGFETYLMMTLMAGKPSLRKTMSNRPAKYTESLSLIHNPPEGTSVIEIAPPADMKTERTTQDLQALETDYQTGVQYGRAFVEKWNT